MTLRDTITRLLRNDARLIFRDRLLVLLLAMVIFMGLAVRYALPAIDQSLAEQGIMPDGPDGMRFSETYEMFAAFIGLWQAALMPGTVLGFVLLDEKEDNTLTALRVTPVPLERYIGYRIALPAALAFAFCLLVFPLMGLVSLPWWQHLLLAGAMCLTAPLTAILLATYADNKVQGLAYTKFGGVAGLAILIGWFVPEPWQWGVGLFPPFLVSKALWMLLHEQPLWWVALGAGFASQAAVLRAAVLRFRSSALS